MRFGDANGEAVVAPVDELAEFVMGCLAETDAGGSVDLGGDFFQLFFIGIGESIDGVRAREWIAADEGDQGFGQFF